MHTNEATARIKINKLLEEAGWRFFDSEEGKANILLENHVKITQEHVDAWGNDFEKTKHGSLDFLLLDSNQKPLCVLEAKKETLHPLSAKEQARKYAKSVDAQYIILSNGIVHYLWDLKKGNPKPIYKFPSPKEIGAIKEWNPDREALAKEPIGEDFIAAVQMPDYAERPEWNGSPEKSKDFVEKTIIPLPPIETQSQIVAQIEKEQELVNANKQLIEIFEQKIKDRIGKVWGSSTTLSTSSSTSLSTGEETTSPRTYAETLDETNSALAAESGGMYEHK
ncbi:MAG: type I restriction enzyme HsdR N-terminal domain-containing protein [Bacteroidales bacterium]|nr:type I restriction enzyme HsdR N-terminal domain-containing protein [Bacteroidales bacterium]